MKNKAKTYILWLVIPVILIGVGIALGRGYRLQPDFTIAKNGSLYASLPLSNMTLFVDDQKEWVTTAEKETLTLPLSVGEHRVIIARNGYFPWSQKITIKPETRTTIDPFFVTENATGEIITTKDPQYWELMYKIKNNPLPNKDTPRTQNNVQIWAEQNTLMMKTADGAVQTIHIFKTPILSLDFYKDRSDVAMIATESGIFDLELIEDAEYKGANIFPVYKGNNPQFLKTDPNFIYVLDGENLMQVVI